MKTVSSRWLGTVSEAHRIKVEAYILSDDSPPELMDVLGGSVTLDASADIRGRVDVDLAPQPNGEVPVSINGGELAVRRGVYHPDGSVETVPLGVFRIQEVDVSDDGGSPSVRVSGMDRAQRVQDAKFEEPYEVPADTVISQAILDTIQLSWPDVPYATGLESVTTLTLPRIVAAEGDDRWEFVQGLAESMGMVLLFDGDGKLTLRPYAAAGPVASVVDGEGGLLLQVQRNWTRDGSFNRVIATGENSSSDEVYRAVATDDDPDSPTYYFGPFGKVPRFYSSPYIRSNDQASDAAQAILEKEIGTAARISFGMIPNPALEPEDTVTVRRLAADVDEDHVIDSVTIGLGPEDSMSVTTRQRRVA